MAKITTLQIYGGLAAGLPTLSARELAVTTDMHQVYIGDGAINYLVGHEVINGTGNPPSATGYGEGTLYVKYGTNGDLALGANSITMTGSIGVTGARVTKGWFTNLEVTNVITTKSIELVGTTSGKVTLTANATAGTPTYVFPAAYGAVGTVLTDAAGNGVLSWATGGGGVPTTITVANEATDTTCFPLFVTAATGDLGPRTNTSLVFNSSTGYLGIGTATPSGQFSMNQANGQAIFIHYLTELTTIAAAATTDTTFLVPASVMVLGVDVRVTVAIPTATTFTVSVVPAAAGYIAVNIVAVPVAINSTDKGLKNCPLLSYATAYGVRITPSATPANNNGRVRVTLHYLDITPATS